MRRECALFGVLMSIINIADSRQTLKLFPWALVFALVLFSLYTLAVSRGENVNAMWLVTAAIGTYAIGYRFYARYIAVQVLRLDGGRATPAWRRNDGLDYVPTERSVLFGHHFAAIAGAGPLVGPVLAAQMGYLPGTLWIIVGVVFAGAVQDMLVLFFSTRRDGRSLGEMIRSELGTTAGTYRDDRHSDDHGHPACGAVAGRGERARTEPLGHLHGRDDHSDRGGDGPLPACLRPGRILEVSLIGLRCS